MRCGRLGRWAHRSSYGSGGGGWWGEPVRAVPAPGPGAGRRGAASGGRGVGAAGAGLPGADLDGALRRRAVLRGDARPVGTAGRRVAAAQLVGPRTRTVCRPAHGLRGALHPAAQRRAGRRLRLRPGAGPGQAEGAAAGVLAGNGAAVGRGSGCCCGSPTPLPGGGLCQKKVHGEVPGQGEGAGFGGLASRGEGGNAELQWEVLGERVQFDVEGRRRRRLD